MAIIRNRSADAAITVLNGSFDALGRIAFGAAAVDNTTTAVPFNASGDALAGKCLMLQADQDCYILTTSSTSTAVTATTGLKIFAGERVEIYMSSAHKYLSVLRVSADGNMTVVELK